MKTKAEHSHRPVQTRQWFYICLININFIEGGFLTSWAGLAAFGVGDFTRHGTFPDTDQREVPGFLLQTLQRERHRRKSFTWAAVCVWAATPSSGLSSPVRTTPSASVSEAATLYLSITHGVFGLHPDAQFYNHWVWLSRFSGIISVLNCFQFHKTTICCAPYEPYEPYEIRVILLSF